MADAHDSKSCIARCEGSSPSSGTMKPKVLVIVGPTASGKSALAVELARKLDGEVVSADSRQVYKGLDIGTGKITRREMRGVPHHLLDVAYPREQFTASKYKKFALGAIKKILSKGKLPIVVGGTGFYIDALRMDLPEVPPNPALRENLENKSLKELQKMLGRHRLKDMQNRVRLIRAIEIIKALGKIPKAKMDKRYNFVFVGLKPKGLDKKIKERLIKRIPGIIRETKKLGAKRAYELGLEYRFASLYLQGKLNKKEFVEKLNTAIRQYAKRQMTWFKRNKDITWFERASSDTTRRVEGLLKRAPRG